MKTLTLLLVAALALLLTACASTPAQRSPTEIDAQYVTSVERSAERVGVDVVWVNPPRKARQPEEDG